jgi:hypothetical protein
MARRSQNRKRIAKNKIREVKVKNKLAKKREILRESRKLQEELEILKRSQEPKLKPFRNEDAAKPQLPD